MKKTLLLFLLLPFLGFAQNANLVKWDNPADNDPIVLSPYTNSVEAEPVSAGPDLTLAPLDYQGFRGSPWTTSFSIDERKYFQFVVGSKPGYKIKLNTFNFTYRAENINSLQRYQVRYSKDGFATSTVLIDEATQSGKVNKSLDLSKITLYNGEKITIRIYGYKIKSRSDLGSPLFLINKNTVEAGNTTPTINGAVSVYNPADLNANDDLITTQEKTAISFNPLTNDTNTTGATITNTQPPSTEGTVSRNGNIFVFTPTATFTGTTSFTYTLTIGAKSATATVVIYVNALTPKLIIWNGADQTPKAVVTDQNITGNDLTVSPPTANQANLELGTYSNYFNINGLQNNGSTAETLNRYIQFSVTVKEKYKLTLKQLKFAYFSQSDDQGASMFQVRYSKDPNFADNGTVFLGPTTAFRGTDTDVTLNFPSGTTISSTKNETLYIRIYPYAVSNLYNGYFKLRNDTGGEVGPTISGIVEPANLITANADFIQTNPNTAVVVPILSNDENYTPLASITATQPSSGGTVQVNGTNNITFTPTAGFTGTSKFEYTIFNGLNYSTATVTVNVSCQISGNQVAFGNGSWIGYVYSFTGNTAPNPAYNTLPTGTGVNYLGTVTETTQNFDRNVEAGAVNGATRNFCDPAPTDRFFVRYKMTANIAEAGQYNFMLGSDDGVRLYVDGVKVLERWNQHSYTVDSVLRNITTTGTHEFILEYFELDGSSRVQISFGLVKGDQTLPYGDKVWNVYGFVKNDLNLSNVVYAGNFVDPSLNVKSTTYWPVDKSPAAATAWQGAPMPNDNFTVSYRRQGFPCGTYRIELANSDDATQIYLDNNLIFTQAGYTNTPAYINTGATYILGSNSKIEVRLREDGGNANVAVNFVRVMTPYTGSETVNSNSSIEISSTVNLGSDIRVCSCTVKAGATLNIPANRTLTVDEDINVINTGKFVIQSGGSLLQTSTSTTMFTGNNANALEVQRKITARRMDLTYWSNPITKAGGFTMHDLSPDTLLDKYYIYDTSLGWVSKLNGEWPMEKGVGYSIRAPQYFDPTTPAEFTGTFKGGVPNNGDINVDVVQGKFNLIGNPYPSAIYADDLIRGNTGLGTLYFWTHNSVPTQSKPGDTNFYYGNADYAAYNLSGNVGGAKLNGKYFEGYIAVGQGFLAKPSSTKVNFNNTMRRAGNNSQFYKSNTTGELEKNRVWLNMSNDEGAYKQLLVGYIEGATNSIDIDYDATTMGSNNYVDFYSINESKKLAIQGRALPFDDTDVIPLGYKATTAGELTISIDHADGFFDKQAVYLEDAITGKTIDLRTENYKFTTEVGTFADRFKLRYTSKTLGTGDFETADNTVFVSVKSKVVKINVTKENIKDVQIYNISGQSVYNKTKIDSNELQITNLPSGYQVLLVKVILENGSQVTKKIIFN
ncbi:T9SS sorting signal type C domain-containing protein [Flavobacterium sp. 17A]|uniref:T9SS sorting signal type C domain-containing protein n=1 Tax=Flavobacterium potami TaxID=2872310 RepID=A0A9X1HA96_9FLAO|nr:T9SS sorting signal type C domain-containing protein [Flavobacterium potami]MBZ4035598.1 T9SS sorting signal type C domain-containing protein [Flavobacterium potami]